jgi:hypothetical protein
MPKTTTPIQSLEEEITRLQAAIASKQSELLEQQTENTGLGEALRLLSVGIAAYIPQGRVQMVDVINNILDESSNKEDRQYHWDACHKAVTSGQQAAASLQSELDQMQQRLAIAEAELDWLQHYAPHVDRYRDGFRMPSPEDIKQQKVRALQNDISDKKMKLQRARLWLNQPQGDRPYYAGDALREAEYLNQAIPVLSQQLERLIAEPVREDKEYGAKFRQYIKARVQVEPALAAFLKAQEQYLVALAQFKLAIAAHPAASEFPGVALGQPRIVSAENGIRLI